jgi:hypothetical protein
MPTDSPEIKPECSMNYKSLQQQGCCGWSEAISFFATLKKLTGGI